LALLEERIGEMAAALEKVWPGGLGSSMSKRMME
jgi:hypothetical protein